MVEMIEIPVGGGAAEACLARPATAKEGDDVRPGVLFYLDAIGLRPQIAAMAQRIADWGYVVLAPNLFHRLGTAAQTAPAGPLTAPGAREAFFAANGSRVGDYTVELSRPDTDAWLTALTSLPGVADGPVGVTGYCMGARLATRAAGDHPDLVAAVGGFHGGGLVTAADDSPHRWLATARAEFVYLHADQDRSMPAEAVAALGEELAARQLVASNAIAPGAPHGYTMADTPSYQEAAAERHYRELADLFARVLG